MYWRNVLMTIASMAALVTAACVGQLDPSPGDDLPPAGSPDAGPGADPPTPPGGVDAEGLFVDNVAPIMARCSGEACHSGTASYPLKFLGTGSPASFYTSITRFPSVVGGWEPNLATVLTKMVPGHSGLPDYSATEKSLITEWLLAERTNRVPDDDPVEPPPPGEPPLVPTDSKQALAQWSGCMTIANWDAAGMGGWSDKEAEGGTVCASCHNDGLMRFHTNAENNTMFSMNRYELFIIGFFTVRVDPDGTNTVIPAYDKLQRMGDGTTLHPTYNTNLDSEYFQRLENFYQLTLATKNANQCAPAQFPTP